MKKIFKAASVATMLLVALFSVITLHVSAQPTKKQVPGLLKPYYEVSQALIDGNAKAAAENATTLVRALNGISYTVVSEGNIHAMVKDAGAIAATGDIEKQRKAFAGLSDKMTQLAKAVDLGDGPIYLQYCPMKKASWLSAVPDIKNPYYGNAMLTCGEVKETIQKQ